MRQQQRRGEKIVDGEVAVRDCVERIRTWPSESKRLRQFHAIDWERRTGESSCAEGALIPARLGRGEALDVALQHLYISQAPVAERDRLGLLGVRISRHWRRCLGFGTFDQDQGEGANV